ncbi:MAG: hypothetical protein ACKPAH_07740 [Verrucomicrobiota bacterium]
MTRHCHRCGWVWTLRDAPGRSESCPQCRADLRICLNCRFHDLQAAHQCRERRAEPVAEKDSANFCEYFDFRLREWRDPAQANPAAASREDQARADLRRLLGGD